ncbi:hypothetical protein [Nocardia fluminea]
MAEVSAAPAHGDATTTTPEPAEQRLTTSLCDKPDHRRKDY